MKRNHFFRVLALATALLCMMAVFAGCDGQGAAGSSTEAEYCVTVTDALGNPYTTGVIVRFLSGEEQIAMQPVDANGVAAKTLTKGDYSVELVFTGDASEYHYEAEGLNLSAEQTELTVILSYTAKGEPQMLFAKTSENAEGKEYAAYPVTEGGTYVELSAADRSFFTFTPKVAGTYEFSVSGTEAAIGYYGAPHFVQTLSAVEAVDNKFTISVSAGMIGTAGSSGTSILVIGVDAAQEPGCILTVERIGDPEHTLADEPWQVYQATAELAPYKLPEGAQIQEFDLTAPTDTYNLVYNETDGFYHLDSADGPLVLVRLGEDNKYLACFQTITDHSGVNKYFYDDNGEFVKKESYTECLMEYYGYMDEDNGVYPLTEDLKYIIQQRGEYAEWWNPEGNFYLFVDDNGVPVPGINNEIAWLFICCYIA